MSAADAGALYEQVINDVIGDSRQDFEDNGIDEQTLQDLKALWQENLAAAAVASLSFAPLESPQHKTAGEVAAEKKQNGESSGMNTFEFEVKDENGDLAKTLARKEESERKKARSMKSLDSDDINSDLDDSDEEDQALDEDGDDGDGTIMLCLYEKVLRVKNKWKCNLKDGVANLNGRDFAFAKATGESEW